MNYPHAKIADLARVKKTYDVPKVPQDWVMPLCKHDIAYTLPLRSITDEQSRNINDC